VVEIEVGFRQPSAAQRPSLGRHTWDSAKDQARLQWKQRVVQLAAAKSPFAGVIPLTTTKQKLLPLSVDEFLCRFLLHILPQGHAPAPISNNVGVVKRFSSVFPIS